MSLEVKILADSLSPAGVRLTTFELTYPLRVHRELLRHRVFSHSVQSNRACPVAKQIAAVAADPYLPSWTMNQPGMVGHAEVPNEVRQEALVAWLWARDAAVWASEKLAALGIHKEHANDLLQPWQWVTQVLSATEWANFYRLRDAADAHPAIRQLARVMRRLHGKSVPQPVALGEWHLPYIAPYERGAGPNTLRQLSAARCARVSYAHHDGRHDPEADLALYTRLVKSDPPHLSPLEHQATPWSEADVHFGNFRGWRQARHMIAGESGCDYDWEAGRDDLD